MARRIPFKIPRDEKLKSAAANGSIVHFKRYLQRNTNPHYPHYVEKKKTPAITPPIMLPLITSWICLSI